MTIVTSYDWESDSFTHHTAENAARQAWRTAVQEIAEKAKATLPDCAGRVERAVQIVLNHDVELLEDGKARVGSQSNGQVVYHLVNGACSCKDYAKAPSNWCKHCIAAGLYKRATALVQRQLAQSNGTSNGQAAVEPAPVQAEPEAPTAPLPEAPASCNVYVTLAGRKVQVTLRDLDEQRMLARLEALLQRFPAEQAPEHPEGWCRKHDVQMTLNNKDGRTWYSHRTAEGWCKGK